MLILHGEIPMADRTETENAAPADLENDIDIPIRFSL